MNFIKMFFNLRSEATIASPVKFHGIGVHSGEVTNMTISPSEKGSGIVFERTDVKNKDSVIKLSPTSVVDPTLCTRVVNRSGVSVAVVEHLLAAFRICGITNALVQLDSHEVPIMDGSARDFVGSFKKVGIVPQEALVPAIVITHTISEESKSGKITINPSNNSSISVRLSYDRINLVIKDNNNYSFTFDDNLNDLASSRTFGWIEDYDKVRSMGLAKGTSEENTVVILPNNSIKNESGLRNPKEIVMHKCLDLVGDISVIGYDIIGEITGINTSHALNNKLMRKLLSEISSHQVFTEKTSADFNTVLNFA